MTGVGVGGKSSLRDRDGDGRDGTSLHRRILQR